MRPRQSPGWEAVSHQAALIHSSQPLPVWLLLTQKSVCVKSCSWKLNTLSGFSRNKTGALKLKKTEKGHDRQVTGSVSRIHMRSPRPLMGIPGLTQIWLGNAWCWVWQCWWQLRWLSYLYVPSGWLSLVSHFRCQVEDLWTNTYNSAYSLITTPVWHPAFLKWLRSCLFSPLIFFHSFIWLW